MIDTIIDLNHQGRPDFAALAQGGIVAVLHKATEGATFQDPEYQTRRVLAKTQGLLWGSYHFVSGASVTDQVDNYVSHAAPAADEAICIDYEHSSSGPDMTLAQLERFVVLLTQRLGRAPMIYGGDLLRHALQLNPSATLAKCPLWYSRYASDPTGIPPAVWSAFTLWQYTDGASGPQPHDAPGIGRCDRSRYDGTVQELRAAWPFSKKAAVAPLRKARISAPKRSARRK
jgi:lysozyme